MPLHVDRDLLSRAIRRAAPAGGEADLFLEHRLSASATFAEGRLLEPSCGVTLGAGLRAGAGDDLRYLHLERPTEERLLLAAGRIREGGPAPQPAHIGATSGRAVSAEPPVDPTSLVPAGLAAALAEVERGALEGDPHLVAVRIDYSAWRQQVLIFDAEGRLLEDERSAVRLRVRATARRGARVEEGTAVVGCSDPADLFASVSTREIGARAAASAAIRLEAKPLPSGEYPVVFANRCGGALFHEALGHALEADLLRRGESPYAGLVGEPVASPLISVADDPTLPGRRGSYRFDDEGTPAARTPLLERGVLKRFLTDRETSRSLGLPASGNGRRASYRDLPLPRMSNLIVEAWKDDPEEILRSTRDGLYVVELGGAWVSFPGGEFAFEVAEGFRIEGGRKGRPVEGAVLVGRGPETLRRVDRVGADFLLDPGAGSCDKDGQRLPIALGQPTIRVSKLTVRGGAA